MTPEEKLAREMAAALRGEPEPERIRYYGPLRPFAAALIAAEEALAHDRWCSVCADGCDLCDSCTSGAALAAIREVIGGDR